MSCCGGAVAPFASISVAANCTRTAIFCCEHSWHIAFCFAAPSALRSRFENFFASLPHFLASERRFRCNASLLARSFPLAFFVFFCFFDDWSSSSPWPGGRGASRSGRKPPALDIYIYIFFGKIRTKVNENKNEKLPILSKKQFFQQVSSLEEQEVAERRWPKLLEQHLLQRHSTIQLDAFVCDNKNKMSVSFFEKRKKIYLKIYL